MNNILILILLFVSLTSCNSTFTKDNDDITPTKKTNTNIRSLEHNDVKIVSTTPVTHMPKTHSKENVALLKLENYLRNSHSIIQQAQALQNKDARYIMNYQELKRDISDIANSINDYVNRDTQDQNPRYFRPLTKRYY